MTSSIDRGRSVYPVGRHSLPTSIPENTDLRKRIQEIKTQRIGSCFPTIGDSYLSTLFSLSTRRLLTAHSRNRRIPLRALSALQNVGVAPYVLFLLRPPCLVLWESSSGRWPLRLCLRPPCLVLRESSSGRWPLRLHGTHQIAFITE